MALNVRLTGTLGRALAHAGTAPERLALQDDTESLSYSQLCHRVGAVAAALRRHGALPGERVALLLDNSVAFVVTALGCMWAGTTFVPLSPDDPPSRHSRILADCRPVLLVAEDGPGDAGRAPHLDGLPCVAPWDLWQNDEQPPPPALGPDRDVFMIYTSGTTGTPKGVRVCDRALEAAVDGMLATVGLGQATRSLPVSPFHFDGSYGNLFPTLVAGGALLMPPRSQLLFLKRFVKTVCAEGVTHTSCGPAYTRMLVSSPLAANLRGTSLRTWVMGGEQLYPSDVARLWELLPDLRVFNCYGPTETTIAVTFYEVTREDVAAGVVPIGKPNPGTAFHLVGPDGGLLDGAGQTGELYVSGPQLMSGYWADAALTERCLRSDVVPGTLAYKTGDLAYRDETGRYFFCGRVDDIVKRLGQRISLTEVTTALRSVAGVTGAVCLPVDLSGQLGIVAFVQADLPLTPLQVLAGAAADLGEWMRPDEVHVVDVLPTTSRGKVDGERLLAEHGHQPWSR